MTEITAVLFDKDGTLLDFQATWGPATSEVLGALAAGDGAAFADMARSSGFKPETQTFQPDSPIIAGDVDAFAPAWAERLGHAYDATFAKRVDTLYRAASLRSLRAYDDVGPALEGLREKGIAIGLATNDSEKTARAHLEALGIDGHFVFVAGYDSGFGPKPAPGMVFAFADFLGIEPEAIAMLGDSGHDMEAGEAAGALPVGVARTRDAHDALAALDVPVLTTFNGLAEALAEIASRAKEPA